MKEGNNMRKNKMKLFDKEFWSDKVDYFEKAKTHESNFLCMENESGVATIHPAFTKALFLYYFNGRFKDTLDVTTYCRVSQSGNIVVASLNIEGNIQVAGYNVSNSEFLFAENIVNGVVSPYTLQGNTKESDGTILWLAMMPSIYELYSSQITPNNYSDFLQKLNDQVNAVNNLSEVNFTEYSVYGRFFIANDKVYCNWDETHCIIPQSNIFPTIPVKDLVESYGDGEILFGYKKMSVDGKVNTGKKATNLSVSPAELRGKYCIGEEVDENCPLMDDYYVTPVWVLKAAHNLWYHHNNKNLSSAMKQNNIFLFGGPGSGKSEGAKGIASALGIPAVHIECSANTDETVFTENIIPKIGRKNCSRKMSFADLRQIVDLSPDTAYEQITGEYKEDVTEEECYEAFFSSSDSGVSYETVESDFVKAVENGWLVTIEEFTNVRDAGVAMIINQLMDGYQSITLPTGRVIKRHPNCVIVFAANVDEQHCGELEASTLSRLKPMYKIETPSVEETIDRVKKITGYDDMGDLRQMTETAKKLSDFIVERQFNGVCGVRELCSWILQYQANMDFDDTSTLKEAAYETILPSCSPRKEDLQECIDYFDSIWKE